MPWSILSYPPFLRCSFNYLTCQLVPGISKLRPAKLTGPESSSSSSSTSSFLLPTVTLLLACAAFPTLPVADTEADADAEAEAEASSPLVRRLLPVPVPVPVAARVAPEFDAENITPSSSSLSSRRVGGFFPPLEVAAGFGLAAARPRAGGAAEPTEPASLMTLDARVPLRCACRAGRAEEEAWVSTPRRRFVDAMGSGPGPSSSSSSSSSARRRRFRARGRRGSSSWFSPLRAWD